MTQRHTFGQRIAHVRTKQGWTQQELARRAQLSYPSVWRIELDLHKDPGISTAARLAKALGVSVDYLIGLYDDEA